MIKSRTGQLVFQTIYCTLGCIGVIASLGIFDNIDMIRWDFYVHFTNLINFLCLGIMFAALFQTIEKDGDGYVTTAPILKFIGLLGIVLTFFVFNILLAGAEGRDPQLNWRIGSLCFHVVLPVMYVVDWFLFYERKKVKCYYPILSLGFPLGYVIFIFIQAAMMKFDTTLLIPGTKTPLIYPYFFLNPETVGIGGVVKWFLFLLIAFVTVGFIFWGIDQLGKKESRI